MNNSLWVDSKERKQYYEDLKDNIETEVCIIGAGLTGLTTGYYLSKEDKKIVIIDKNKIGEHTSGNTTGKITSSHGLFYDYLSNSLGKDYAKKYLETMEHAINNIEQIVDNEHIDCDFEKVNNYIFTKDKSYLKQIKKEVNVVNSLIEGKAEFVNNLKFMKGIFGAIKFNNQAQFNSYKYMIGLSKKITEYGGKIYEDTEFKEIKKEDDYYLVITNGGVIKAKYVVIASHYPIINFPGFYFMKMYQETSYLIAVEINNELYEGMYINCENPTISLRTAIINNKRVAIIGGLSHKTGEKIDLDYKYKELEKIAKEIYPDCKVLYKWNTEDCVSLDKIPYIGEFSRMMPNVFVATGYKKWGMTTSNVAANIISDMILERKNDYIDIFDSRRIKPLKNYKELTNMIKEVGNSLILEKLKSRKGDLENIKNGEGKIIEIDNEKVGIYKDEQGNVYGIKPVCTHLGCELTWNNLDKTWDCPCHGSRFNYEGKNIYEPAIDNLETIIINNENKK